MMNMVDMIYVIVMDMIRFWKMSSLNFKIETEVDLGFGTAISI